MNVERTIRDYLPDIVHLSLGTSANNRPWVCEVHFVYDNHLNLYFRSMPSRRHSQEIAQNPFVAGNIIQQHPLGQKALGVYFEGTASLLDDFSQEHPVYKLFKDRLGLGPEIIEDAANEDGHKVYKIVVTDYYLFDARYSKPSQKYHLPRKTIVK